MSIKNFVLIFKENFRFFPLPWQLAKVEFFERRRRKKKKTTESEITT